MWFVLWQIADRIAVLGDGKVIEVGDCVSVDHIAQPPLLICLDESRHYMFNLCWTPIPAYYGHSLMTSDWLSVSFDLLLTSLILKR